MGVLSSSCILPPLFFLSLPLPLLWPSLQLERAANTFFGVVTLTLQHLPWQPQEDFWLCQPKFLPGTLQCSTPHPAGAQPQPGQAVQLGSGPALPRASLLLLPASPDDFRLLGIISRGQLAAAASVSAAWCTLVSQRTACRQRWLPEEIGCGFGFRFPHMLHPNSRRFLASLLHGLRAQVPSPTQRRQTGLPSAPGSGP